MPCITFLSVAYNQIPSASWARETIVGGACAGRMNAKPSLASVAIELAILSTRPSDVMNADVPKVNEDVISASHPHTTTTMSLPDIDTIMSGSSPSGRVSPVVFAPNRESEEWLRQWRNVLAKGTPLVFVATNRHLMVELSTSPGRSCRWSNRRDRRRHIRR